MSKEIFNPEYMVGLPLLDNPMFPGALLSCLIAAIILVMIWLKRRRWFLQPSLIIFAVIHVRIQWPSMLYYEWANDHMLFPWHFFMLTQIFPLVYLAAMIPIAVYRDSMLREFAERINRQMQSLSAWPTYLFYFCLVVSFIISAIALMIIPFASTAVYALFTDPSRIGEARSLVWREMTSRTLLYLVGWNSFVFGPLLLFGSVYSLLNQRKLFGGGLWSLLGLVVSFFAMVIPGHRVGFFVMGAVVFAAYFCARRRMPSKITLYVCAFLVLSIPALISLLREGRDWTFEKQIEYTNRIFTHRVMMVPCYTGILYTYDAQSVGYSGAAGIRPLAMLMGVGYEGIASKIGKEYVYGGKGTYSNSNAIFMYYSVMGLFAIPFTVVGLLCLDLLLYFLQWRSIALLPFVILFISKSFQASETALTIVVFTGGLFFVPILVLFSKLPPETNMTNNTGKS